MLFWWIWKCFYVLDDLFFLPFFFSFLFFPSFLFCYHKRHSIIQNLFQKLNIFKTECSSSKIWDCQWHKTFSVTPVFNALILFLFQIIKKYQCCGFTFTDFFLLPPTTKALATSWVTFSQTRILVFFQFFYLTFP